MSRWTRSRAAGLHLLLVVASLGLCCLLLEGFLRITHVQPDFFWQLDPEVGAIHIPGKKGWVVFRGGRQYVEIKLTPNRAMKGESAQIDIINIRSLELLWRPAYSVKASDPTAPTSNPINAAARRRWFAVFVT